MGGDLNSFRMGQKSTLALLVEELSAELGLLLKGLTRAHPIRKGPRE